MTRYGITIPLPGRALADHVDVLRRIEDLGYTGVHTRETDGPDAFTPLALAAACAPGLRVGSVIAGVHTRGPALLAMQVAALADAAPGRCMIGLGSSSRTVVEDWNGLRFARPLARMQGTLRFLRDALAGGRIDADYGAFRVRGFRLASRPAQPPRLCVAGLGPAMRRLAATEADGLLLSLVAPPDVALLAGEARRIARTRTDVGDFEIGMRIGLVVGDDADGAREHCRRILAAYLNVDVYRRLHTELGRGDTLAPIVEAWERGDRRGAVEAVPDDLVDALFIHGPPDACRAGLERFADAGVDTLIASLMRWDGPLEAALEALAPRGR